MTGESVMKWRKSSRSMQNGSCVEAGLFSQVVATRDSKHRAGGVLTLGLDEWRSLIGQISSDAFKRTGVLNLLAIDGPAGSCS